MLTIIGGGHAEVFLNKFSEEGEAGEIEFNTDFLRSLVAITKLLSDGVDGGLVNVVEWRTTGFFLHTLIKPHVIEL